MSGSWDFLKKQNIQKASRFSVLSCLSWWLTRRVLAGGSAYVCGLKQGNFVKCVLGETQSLISHSCLVCIRVQSSHSWRQTPRPFSLLFIILWPTPEASGWQMVSFGWWFGPGNWVRRESAECCPRRRLGRAGCSLSLRPLPLSVEQPPASHFSFLPFLALVTFLKREAQWCLVKKKSRVHTSSRFLRLSVMTCGLLVLTGTPGMCVPLGEGFGGKGNFWIKKKEKRRIDVEVRWGEVKGIGGRIKDSRRSRK
jgi:hypothetical protein